VIAAIPPGQASLPLALSSVDPCIDAPPVDPNLSGSRLGGAGEIIGEALLP
jgi:hypothetical protein